MNLPLDIRKKLDAEALECSRKRLLARVLKVVERPDGSRAYLNRKSGAVVGATPPRVPGREEIEF
jgi:hypothetical protein